MAGKYYWIKERRNPQLGTYYVAMGRITTAEARQYESPRLYGSNILRKYATQEAYDADLSRLITMGERVQGA